MKMVQWLNFTFTTLSVMLALVACGGATPTAIAPVGAANGLNTFIYVYSEN